MAATRFYFNTGTAGAISLAQPLGGGGIWESNVTNLQTTRQLGLTALGTANNASNPYGVAVTVGNGTNPNDVLWFQGLTAAIPAQTISGTVKGVLCCRESNSVANAYTNLGVFVVDSGGTRVATLYGGSTSGGSEINSVSANNRNVPRQGSVSLTPYACASTDRIVVEIGVRIETTDTTRQVYMYMGDPGGSDLPSGDGTSNNLTINPWIEFSADLFNPPAAGGARAFGAMMGSYHDQEDRELAGWKRSRSGLLVRRWED